MAVTQTIQDLIKSGIFEANGNQPVLIDGVYYQPIATQIGSGMDAQQGPIENVVTYKAADNQVGGDVNWYDTSGNLQQTTKQQDVNATKDFMDFALTAGTMFGLPTEIGKTIGLGSNAVGQAVGQGLLTTGTKLGGGANLEDALKAGVLSGSLVYGGNQLSDAIKQATPIDASNMTSAKFNDSLENQLVKEMQTSGLTKDQINAFMDDMGIGKGITTFTVATTPTVPADTVLATGARPTTVNVGDVFATTPKLEVTGNKDKSLDLNQVINMINAGNLDATNTVNNVADTVNTNKKTDLSASDMIRLAGVGATVAALTANQGGGNGTTTFPIVPVPEEWTSPVRTKEQNATLASQYPKLNPIDFGDKNLLIGTQWEKFLSPTYGQVPTPVQYSQPSNLSYNDLMGILGSKQGMPFASSLSINDIISGIQNQYGQTAKS